MKKIYLLFAAMTAAVFNANARVQTGAGEYKTIPVKLDSANFRIDAFDHTTFSGYDADSAYCSFSIKNTGYKCLVPGTFGDSIFHQLMYNGSINLVEGKSDIVIVMNEDTYNVKYTMVGEKYTGEGRDTAIYDIDVTFIVPKELTYYEAETNAAIRKEIYNKYAFNYQDSTYRYYMSIGVSHFVEGDTMWLSMPDTTAFNVYDLNSEKSSLLYKGFSGWFIATQVAGDTTFNIKGELLCLGNIKFYINCKKPMAVENVNDNLNENVKFFRDGKLYIRKGEAIYDAKGAKVE